jgi:hypothetical protein
MALAVNHSGGAQPAGEVPHARDVRPPPFHNTFMIPEMWATQRGGDAPAKSCRIYSPDGHLLI